MEEGSSRTGGAPIAGHVLVGMATAVVAGVVDGVICAFDPAGTAAWPLAVAVATIISMYLPPCLAFGLGVGLLVAALRQVRWLRPLGIWLRSPAQVVRSRPDTFANGLAALVAAGAFLGALTLAAHTIFTRYHAPWLAAAATAAAALVITLGAVLVFALTGLAAKRVARIVPSVARPILLVPLVLLAAAVAIPRVLGAWPTLLTTYHPVRVLWLPGMGVVFVVLAVSWAAFVAAKRVSAGRQRIAASVLALASIVGNGVTAATYGRDNRVRVVVEEHSVGGRALLRSYLSATDRDADGFSFAFGGGDCNDNDPFVYPGSYDRPGDGIDSDCFGGDGAPDIGAIGPAGFGERPPGLLARPNILLITVDALRPDHLGCFGYERPTSPHIDAFAADAVRFGTVVAPSSRSIRSIPAMLTGLYPSQIAFGDELPRASLHEENDLLAELVGRRGWRTAAVVGTRYFDRSHGFYQGFDEVVTIDSAASPRAAVADRALVVLREMSTAAEPFFLWVHIFNVHQPYLSRTETSRFGEEPVDAYDEEIVLADEQVGRILDAIDVLDLRDSTVVVLASDHGEAFGEHGTSGHSETLYEEEILAVLMVRVPSLEPRDVGARVGLIDVTPTLLNLVGGREPPSVPSRSLLPLMTGEGELDPDRPMISELMPDGHQPFDRKSLTIGRYKLHWWVRENRYELYDLEADPGERNELSVDQPDRARELLGTLRAWSASNSRPENRRRQVIDLNRLAAPPARMQHRLDLGFQGVFTLLGYDVHETQVSPGGSLSVDFYYRVDAETERNFYFVFEGRPPAGHPRLHYMRSEHYPLSGRYFTNEWREGEILRDSVTLALPDELMVGAALALSLTIREGGRPQVFANRRTRIELGSVTVRARPSPRPIAPPPVVRPDGGAPSL